MWLPHDLGRTLPLLLCLERRAPQSYRGVASALRPRPVVPSVWGAAVLCQAGLPASAEGEAPSLLSIASFIPTGLGSSRSMDHGESPCGPGSLGGLS